MEKGHTGTDLTSTGDAREREERVSGIMSWRQIRVAVVLLVHRQQKSGLEPALWAPSTTWLWMSQEVTRRETCMQKVVNSREIAPSHSFALWAASCIPRRLAFDVHQTKSYTGNNSIAAKLLITSFLMLRMQWSVPCMRTMLQRVKERI